MSLEFNLPAEAVEGVQRVERYKPFFGRNTDQMPLLLAEGRVPMDSADFLQRRIDVLQLYKEAVKTKDPNQIAVAAAVRNKWWDAYADTVALWILHPDKGGKIVPYDGSDGKVMQVLKQITPKAPLVDSALALPD